jgi:hypothetical protein
LKLFVLENHPPFFVAKGSGGLLRRVGRESTIRIWSGNRGAFIVRAYGTSIEEENCHDDE